MIELLQFLDKLTDIAVIALIIYGVVSVLVVGVAFVIILSIFMLIRKERNKRWQ